MTRNCSENYDINISRHDQKFICKTLFILPVHTPKITNFILKNIIIMEMKHADDSNRYT